jgi:hypothetical protein
MDTRADDNDETQPEIGFVYNINPAERPGAGPACERFADIFSGSGTVVRQRKGNVDYVSNDQAVLRGGERDMRDYRDNMTSPSLEGQDALGFDNVDLAMYSGHGTLVDGSCGVASQMMLGGTFGIPERVNHSLTSDQISWGDQDLEWVIMYCCRFLSKDDQLTAQAVDRSSNPGAVSEDGGYRWEDFTSEDDLDRRLGPLTIGKGLHTVLGFGTREWVVAAMGEATAERITDVPPRTIVDAWFASAYDNQAQDKRTEQEVWKQESIWDPDNLAVAYGTSAGMNDYFWGHGTVSDDPNSFDPGVSDIRKQQCDAEEGPDLPDKELPTSSFEVTTETKTVTHGQVITCQAIDGQFDTNGVIVRLRESGASGIHAYMQADTVSVEPSSVTFRIPDSLQANKSYQVLFLNHDMTFTYLDTLLDVVEQGLF